MAWSTPRTWTTSEVVTAAHMNQEIRDNFNAAFPDEVESSSYVPGLAGTNANPAVSQTGRQYKWGALQAVWHRIVMISPGGGDGTYFVTLPAEAVGITASTTQGAGSVIGSWQARDNSVPRLEEGSVVLATSNTVRFNAPTSGGGVLGDTAPWAWSVDDVLSWWAIYPVA